MCSSIGTYIEPYFPTRDIDSNIVEYNPKRLHLFDGYESSRFVLEIFRTYAEAMTSPDAQDSLKFPTLRSIRRPHGARNYDRK
ncbi:hypothetical protein Plhal304r1_c017g0063301 [Plasmopara halstedii]